MAIVRMTGAQAKLAARSDGRKIAATTEKDIRRHLVEDGFDPDAPMRGLRDVATPAAIRKKIGMSQQEFATALRIPLATLQNWEQGRTLPDPAARSLLALVDADPKRAFKILEVADGA